MFTQQHSTRPVVNKRHSWANCSLTAQKSYQKEIISVWNRSFIHSSYSLTPLIHFLLCGLPLGGGPHCVRAAEWNKNNASCQYLGQLLLGCNDIIAVYDLRSTSAGGQINELKSKRIQKVSHEFLWLIHHISLAIFYRIDKCNKHNFHATTHGSLYLFCKALWIALACRIDLIASRCRLTAPGSDLSWDHQTTVPHVAWTHT